MDFVHDAPWRGRRFKVLAVVDIFSREVLALVVYTSIGGARVGQDLDERIAIREARPPS